MKKCETCGLMPSENKTCSVCRNRTAAAPRGQVIPPSASWAFAGLIGIVLVTLALVRPSQSEQPVTLQQEQVVIEEKSPQAAAAAYLRQAAPDTATYYSPKQSGDEVIVSDARAREVPESDAAPDPDATDQTEPAPIVEEPVLVVGFGSVALGGAQFVTVVDEFGNGTPVGSVEIANNGDFAIYDYRLTLEIGGFSYPLQPIEGYPRIEPGDQVSVPVTANMPAGLVGAGSVTIQASVEGPPGTVYGSAATFSG